MSLDWNEIENQVYQCVKCKALVKGKDLIFLDQLKCPYCKFRVLRKIRPPIVRRHKAI